MDFAIETQADGSLRAEIFGAIDEHAHKPLKRLATTIGSRKAVLDCAAIDMINSMGVVYWIDFMKELQGTATIVIERCSISLVQQFNRVPSMFRGATVASVFAPFHCAQCDKYFSELLGQDAIEEQEYPEVLCPHCKVPMDPDMDVENYLTFG